MDGPKDYHTKSKTNPMWHHLNVQSNLNNNTS